MERLTLRNANIAGSAHLGGSDTAQMACRSGSGELTEGLQRLLRRCATLTSQGEGAQGNPAPMR